MIRNIYCSWRSINKHVCLVGARNWQLLGSRSIGRFSGEFDLTSRLITGVVGSRLVGSYSRSETQQTNNQNTTTYYSYIQIGTRPGSKE